MVWPSPLGYSWVAPPRKRRMDSHPEIQNRTWVLVSPRGLPRDFFQPAAASYAGQIIGYHFVVWLGSDDVFESVIKNWAPGFPAHALNSVSHSLRSSRRKPGAPMAASNSGEPYSSCTTNPTFS